MSEAQTAPADANLSAPAGRKPRGLTGRILEQGGDVPDEHAKREHIDYGDSLAALEEGQVVTGTVVHFDRNGVLVDIGTKSEGIIPLNELSRDSSRRPENIVEIGGKVDVYVLNADDEETGQVILSKRRADFEKAWDHVIEAQKAGEKLQATVT